MRIALFQLGYETNTFMDGQVELKDIGCGHWVRADELTGTHTGLGGILDALKERGAEAVPMDSVTRGGAYSAGAPLSHACVEESIDHLCQELASRAGEYDAVCAAMHGDGVDINGRDVDGYYFHRIRQVIGDKKFFVSLDLHAKITQEMMDNADAIFVIRTYPHTDFYETAHYATHVLCDTLEGKCDPKMSFVTIPMLVPVANSCTLTGIGQQLMNYVESFTKEKNLIFLSYAHAFPGTDNRHTRASVIAMADGRIPQAEAAEAARHIWDSRHEYMQPSLTAEEAVEEALQKAKTGYVVINDGSDNPGSGCPGDGTYLLAEFIRRDLPGLIMGPIWDAEAAKVCHTHQVGDRFTLEVGGHINPVHGAPLNLTVELMALSDGCFTCVSPMYAGSQMCYGPSARLRTGNVEFIVTTKRFQVYDDRPFLMTGADLKDYKVVGLKSQVHFRAYFKDTAEAIVQVDTPSAFPADIRKLNFQKVQRPIFPLDMDTEFSENLSKE